VLSTLEPSQIKTTVFADMSNVCLAGIVFTQEDDGPVYRYSHEQSARAVRNFKLLSARQRISKSGDNSRAVMLPRGDQLNPDDTLQEAIRLR
jgi:hypothetical protein